MNRVGDWGLTIGILYIYNVYQNYDYSVISGVGGVIPREAGGYIMVMTIYILIGAIAKSAQIGQVKAYSLRIAGNSLYSFSSVDIRGKRYFRLYSGKCERQEDNQQGVDNKFKEWLIGFTEGDGSFLITNGKPRYTIHLNKMDLPLLYYIQSELRMGNVYISRNSAIYIVKAKGDIFKLIEIFNGKIYLDKVRKRFEEWVKYYNLRNKTEIKLIKEKRVINLTDDWLAGFTDAEGCFTITVSGKKVFQRYILAQKSADLELNKIAELLNGNCDNNKDKNAKRVVVSYSNAENLIEYFHRCELRSVKRISFKKWEEVYEMRRSGEISLSEIKKRGTLINNLRKVEELRL